MKSIAVAIIIAALVYSDAAYMNKFGTDYNGAKVVAILFFSFIALFLITLGV